MRIRSIRFADHAVLGNLSLSFSEDASSPPLETIILAGDNGCGKTVILNEIYTSLGEINLEKKSKVEFEIDFSDADRRAIDNYLEIDDCGCQSARIIHGPEQTGTWENIKINLRNRNGVEINGLQIILPSGTRPLSSRPFRVYFSEAAVGFQTAEISTIGASDVDKSNAYAVKAGSTLGQQITSLLIDIRAQDNEDYVAWVETHPGQTPPMEIKDKRLDRFKKAIEYMFPLKRFKGIVSVNGKYKVEFDENGKTTSLNDLSTGEKQIIFRGGFLLRDRLIIDGSIVLIDEPELSLHPSWQAKILSFYRSILPMGTQLIMATHSPFIIHAQSENLRLAVLQKTSQGCSEIVRSPFAVSDSERIVQAFNVSSLISLSSKDVVVLVEGDSDKVIIEELGERSDRLLCRFSNFALL